MKNKVTILFLLVVLSISLHAQGSLGVFIGYGQSSFDEEDLDQAGYIPMGLQAGFNFNEVEFGSVFVGGELNYAVLPFTFETNGDLGNGEEKLAELKINQLFIGAITKIKFGKGFAVPYFRLGAGAYMGKGEIEYTDALKNYYKDLGESIENEDQDFNTAFGFNFGGGLDYTINNSTIFYSEFVYHIVEREVDDEESESFSANNWAIQIGVQFGF